MSYEPQSRIGQKVKFQKYTRPFEMVTGVIIAERKDLDEERYRKPMRYEIKPDRPISETYDGNVVRYHPPMIEEFEQIDFTNKKKFRVVYRQIIEIYKN